MSGISKTTVRLADAVKVGHFIAVDIDIPWRSGRVVHKRAARDGEAERAIALKVNGVVAASAAPRLGAEVVTVVAEHVKGARVANGRVAVSADGAVLRPDDDKDVLAVMGVALFATRPGVALVGVPLAGLDDGARVEVRILSALECRTSETYLSGLADPTAAAVTAEAAVSTAPAKVVKRIV